MVAYGRKILSPTPSKWFYGKAGTYLQANFDLLFNSSTVENMCWGCVHQGSTWVETPLGICPCALQAYSPAEVYCVTVSLVSSSPTAVLLWRIIAEGRRMVE